MIWDDMIWKDETCDFDVICVCDLAGKALEWGDSPTGRFGGDIYIESEIEIEIENEIVIEIVPRSGGRWCDFSVSICGGGTPYCVVCRGVTPHCVCVEVYSSFDCCHDSVELLHIYIVDLYYDAMIFKGLQVN